VNVLTHLLADWTLAAPTQGSRRDRALVAWAGVLPDLDGAGLLVDFAARLLGLAETSYYQDYHRLWGHGLPAALLIALAAGACARQRARVAAWSFAAVHLHLLMDLAGSRGGDPEDIWPIHYLMPLSRDWTVAWAGQWELVSWQNTLITALLIAASLALALRYRCSPCELVSPGADRRVVAALEARWRTASK